MSKDLGDLGASPEPCQGGPDYFAFYTQEIKNLLSPDENFLPFSSSQPSESSKRTHDDKKDVNEHILNGKESSSFSGSLSQGISAELSDFKKEKLKSLLQQAVVSLSQEVDNMQEPVFVIHELQSQLRSRKSLTNHKAEAYKGDVQERPRKKMKLSSLSSSGLENADLPILHDGKTSCDLCHATKTLIKGTNSKELESRCNAGGLKSRDDKNPESCRVSSIEANIVSKEEDDDLQFLIENDTASVKSSVKKNSDELFTTLEHMEEQLEMILDILQSSNKLMTLTEKQQLQKLIQKLPSRNLDRVVEIIQRNKPIKIHISDAVHVDLEKEDNVTLWRLYVYVKAVENAKKLVGSSEKLK